MGERRGVARGLTCVEGQNSRTGRKVSDCLCKQLEELSWFIGSRNEEIVLKEEGKEEKDGEIVAGRQLVDKEERIDVEISVLSRVEIEHGQLQKTCFNMKREKGLGCTYQEY